MSAFYDDLADTATDMLAEFGQAVTITKAGAPTYDPATGTTSTTGGGTQTASGAVFEYSTFIRSGMRNDPGTLILSGDKQLILSPTATDGTDLAAPAANDTATFNGATFTITAVAPNSPAGTAVYFECNIRGAV